MSFPRRHIGFVVGFLLLLLPAGCSTDSSQITPQPRVHKIGDKGYLSGGSERTFIATDEEALGSLVKSLVAKDETGVKDLMMARRVLTVPNDTKVLIIDLGSSGGIKIRILEGEYQERAFWSDKSWVKLY